MLTKREPNTPLDVLDQDFPPQTLICRDCRQAFEFTVEEQQFFLSKGYWRPIRCPSLPPAQARRLEARPGEPQ